MARFFCVFKWLDSKALCTIGLAACLFSTAPKVLATGIEKQRLYSGVFEGRSLVLRIFGGRRPYPLEDLAGVLAQYFFQADGKLVTLRERDGGWLEECDVQYHGRIQCKSDGVLWRVVPREGGSLDLVRRGAGESTSTVPTMRELADGADNPLCDGPAVKGKPQTIGGITFSLLKDPRSSARVPMLLGGLPRAKLDQFNRLRARELTVLSCEELELLPYGGGTEDERVVQFASKKYLSWGGRIGAYSGGTTGNQAYSVVTYDLTDLTVVRAESLFKGIETKPFSAAGAYPLRMEGRPRNLEELVWQQVRAKAKRWPWPVRQADERLDPSEPTSLDEIDNGLLYRWFDNESTCEWDDRDRIDRDRPLRCWLEPGENNFQAMLTNKGLAILFQQGRNLGWLTIPWRQASAVLRPGVTLK